MAKDKDIRRIVIVAPMRSHCETVRMIFSNGIIPQTYLRIMHGNALDQLATLENTFGIVAKTGTGKTVFLRDIAVCQFGENFSYDVVTSEEQSTDKTWESDVLIVTCGVAMHYLKAGYISEKDVIIIDEVHQTSAHMELVMALARQMAIRVNFMSATIDPKIYAEYFQTEKLLECAGSNPDKRAKIEIQNPGKIRVPMIEWYLSDLGVIHRVISGQHGVAVFLPTRAMCENYAMRYQQDGLHTDFYHGGEPANKLKAFIKGEISKPFIIFMTIAGSSSLNIAGLDWVIIQDEMYAEVNHYGVRAMEMIELGANEILQMAGRVDGRKKGGIVTILTKRYYLQYEQLKPMAPKFVLSGDLEAVALICAEQGIDLNELDPIEPINHAAFYTTWNLLVQRKLITPENMLTDYGKLVAKIPVSRIWAEHMIVAMELYVKGESNLFPFVLICSACPSLYNILFRDGKYNIKEFIVKNNDFLTKYNILKHIIVNFTQEMRDGTEQFWLTNAFYGWAKERGIYHKSISSILIAIAAICRSLNLPLNQFKATLPAVTEPINKEFKKLLLKVSALEFVNCSGQLRNNEFAQIAKTSLCNNDEQNCAMCGEMNIIRTNKGEYVHLIEGALIAFDEAQEFLDQRNKQLLSIKLSQSGKANILTYIHSGFGFKTFLQQKISCVKLSDSEFNDEQIQKAEDAFAAFLANYHEYYICDEEFEWDFRNENEKMLRQLYDNHWKFNCNFTDSYLTFADKCYQKLLRRSGVYNLTLADDKQFSLKLTTEMFPEYAAAKKEENLIPLKAEKKSELSAPSRNDLYSNSPRIVVRADQLNRTAKVYQHDRAGKKNQEFAEIFPWSRLAANPVAPKPRKLYADPANKKAEPKEKTADWLIAAEEKVRREIIELERTRLTQQQRADALGAAYNKLFLAKQNTIDALGQWQDACRAIEKLDKDIKEKKQQADQLTDEALQIMEG